MSDGENCAPTFKLSMALMTRFKAGEYCGGKEGILPDLTNATNSACVVAKANGDLKRQPLRLVA
jgi:hypothetical protein